MAKPVYDQAQVIAALTTADGTTDSAAWGRDQISYSLSSPIIAEGEPYYSPYYEGYVPLTAAMEARAHEAFALWDDLVEVELIELPEIAEEELGLRANILLNASTNTEDDLTYTLITTTDEPNVPRSTDTVVDAEIWLAADDPALDEDADAEPGALGFLLYLHHIGHALGLTHGGPYNIGPDYETDATHSRDTRQYTVMSPFDAGADGSGTDHAGAFAAAPLLHDILAVQAVYGADMTTRTGDTTYGFNATAGRDAFDFTRNTQPVVAIWDAGGTDTLDVSGFGQAQVIDLNEGAFSSVGGLTNNVAIAFGVAVENAVGGGGDDLVTGTAAANRLDGGGGRDRIEGGDGADNIAGGDGDDALFGGDGDDRLDGGADDDELTGGDGADALIGGFGEDTALYTAAAARALVDLERQELNAGAAAGDTLSGIENLAGSAFDDTLRGDGADNALLGHDGDDVLEGRGGADTLSGASGRDRLDGGSGDDTLEGGTGDDDLTGGAGADALEGGPGNDSAVYADAAAGVRVDFNRPLLNRGIATGDTYSGIENIAGSDFDDRLAGNAAGNAIRGGDGDDRLEGRRGADALDGGNGHDTLDGGPGHDTLDGGTGDDDLTGGNGADALDGGPGDDSALYSDAAAGVHVDFNRPYLNRGIATGDTYSGIENIAGSDFDDRLAGNAAGNAIRGGDGDDRLEGRRGADRLDGGPGRDGLEGGPGDDTLEGGDGDDTLDGGGGGDRFIFNDGDNRDTVDDFAGGADTLVLDRDLWGGATLSTQQVIDRYAILEGDDAVFDFGGGDSITLLDVGTLALAGDLQLV